MIYRLGQRDHPDHPYADPPRDRASRRRPELPAIDDQAVRPDRLCARRFPGAPQQLQQHPARKLPVHDQAFADIRKRLRPGGVRHVQLLPAGLDRRSPATRCSRRPSVAGNPIVFNLPTRSTVNPDDVTVRRVHDDVRRRHRDQSRRPFANIRNTGCEPIVPAMSRTPNGFELSTRSARRGMRLRSAQRTTSTGCNFAPTDGDATGHGPPPPD